MTLAPPFMPPPRPPAPLFEYKCIYIYMNESMNLTVLTESKQWRDTNVPSSTTPSSSSSIASTTPSSSSPISSSTRTTIAESVRVCVSVSNLLHTITVTVVPASSLKCQRTVHLDLLLLVLLVKILFLHHYMNKDRDELDESSRMNTNIYIHAVHEW